jgi:competence protein ComGC
MSTPAQSPGAKATRAFTVTELLVMIVCLALLAAILLSAIARSKRRASRVDCSSHVLQIEVAFRVWSLDHNNHFPMQVSATDGGTLELVASGVVYPHFQAVSDGLGTAMVLRCPEDKKRSYPTNFTTDLADGKLSYFLNMDSNSGDGSSLLCGDRNLTNRAPAGSRLVSVTRAAAIAWTKEIHSEKGWLGFGDRRVGFFSNGSVGAAFKIGDGGTNRLAVP